MIYIYVVFHNRLQAFLLVYYDINLDMKKNEIYMLQAFRWAFCRKYASSVIMWFVHVGNVCIIEDQSPSIKVSERSDFIFVPLEHEMHDFCNRS